MENQNSTSGVSTIVSRRCQRCNGSGTVVGIFPIYANHVPPEKRKRTIELTCDVCSGTGQLDEHFEERAARGLVLRKLRLSHDLSSREFAKRFKLNLVLVSDYERGKYVDEEIVTRIQTAIEELEGNGG